MKLFKKKVPKLSNPNFPPDFKLNEIYKSMVNLAKNQCKILTDLGNLYKEKNDFNMLIDDFKSLVSMIEKLTDLINTVDNRYLDLESRITRLENCTKEN